MDSAITGVANGAKSLGQVSLLDFCGPADGARVLFRLCGPVKRRLAARAFEPIWSKGPELDGLLVEVGDEFAEVHALVFRV